MMELAERLCREAVRRGAQFAEASVDRMRGIEVEIDGNSLKSAEEGDASSVSVSAYIGGGRGTFSGHGIGEKDALAGVERAVSLARASSPDPDFRSIAENLPAPEVGGLYDDAVKSLKAATLVDWALAMVEEARAVDASALVFGQARSAVQWGAFCNSLGIRDTYGSTFAAIDAYAVVRRSEDTGSFQEFEESRSLAGLKTRGVGERAAREALRYLGARQMRSGEFPVVLGPLAVESFIEAILESAGADHVQRNRSFLGGRLGKKIGSKDLTVIDDGTRAGGVESSSRDAEGFPRKPLTVIEEGVLRSYLHNTYTALKASTQSTGHCAFGGATAPTNIIIRPGRASAQEIIADTREGLYISMAELAADPASSELSATVDFGFKIENGRLAFPVANTMVAGRALEMLAAIDAVSSDYREIPGSVFPTMRIARMQVSG